ncbi:Fe2+-dependent dioxygenase [Marinicauda algicola]|uniref:Fe2+-dependent dioxygenase n=1 Tax=Marinicauda algicola TaxID=2029849 RepID=A0A4S2GYA9_9PROT|nr:Fe2+-dependent dioxygenase [Marinicauda algicola]TGY87762.1 Fe2+-dependent dioxygenase [Marinicauda algicola]
MTALLQNVLTAEEIARIGELVTGEDRFEDGKATAGWAAKRVKANEQAKSGPRLDAVRRLVRAALERHELFASYAVPKAVFRILVSRYRPGMEYGLHVDDAIMSGHRADLSFTLFLSDPSSYEGGELVIEAAEGETAIKLEPGQAVVYPTGALHRVAPVASGERLAIVGWVQSLVRRADRREVVFDLDQTIRALHQAKAPQAAIDRLLKTKANLMRQWAEV